MSSAASAVDADPTDAGRRAPAPSSAAPDGARRLRGSRRGRRRRARPSRAVQARRGIALLAGVALGTAFAPVGWWPLAIVAVAALTLVVRGRGVRESLLPGLLFGIGLCGVSISWVAMLGWWVAPILVVVMALWWMLLAGVLAAIQHVPAAPLLAAFAWTAAEYGMATVPFGGFPWLRLVWTTIDQPLSGWLPVLGAVGTSWLVALAGQALATLVRPVRSSGSARPAAATPSPRRPRSLLRRGGAATALVAMFAGGALLRARPVDAGGAPLRVGIVQGDVSGTAGPHAMGYARSVTANHLSETITLMAKARTGLTPTPDLVLWPENSTDIDPTRDLTTRERVEAAELLSQRPLLVGAVVVGPRPQTRQTASLWWSTMNTVQSRYLKRNLVPFGEYIPFRSLVLPVVPVLKAVGQQSIPGTGPGVVTGTLADGQSLTAGSVICFELAWDSTVADTVTHGAQVVLVQSNNADYVGTGQPPQQFMITRGRAMELRREIVVSTTDSLSGLIDARGRVHVKSREQTAFSTTVTVPRRTGVTLGVRLDPWLDRASLAVVVLALLLGAAQRRGRRGRVRVQPGTPDADGAGRAS